MDQSFNFLKENPKIIRRKYERIHLKCRKALYKNDTKTERHRKMTTNFYYVKIKTFIV